MSIATPDTIARLDFSETPRYAREAGRLERDECHRLLAEFIERYDVRPFRKGYRNLQALFKQGGAGNQKVKEVLRRYFGAHQFWIGSSYGKGSPFGHSELWGRDGVPLIFIGHPYGISDEGQLTLDAIRGLGLVVADYHPGWYGFGTVQVRAYHASTLQQCGRRVS